MPGLHDTAVAEGLQRLPGWERCGNAIIKTFAQKDFAHAMVFVNEVADAAEAAGHQADIDIRWNKGTLALSSHAQGGLTDRHFQLAAPIQLYRSLVAAGRLKVRLAPSGGPARPCWSRWVRAV